MDEAKTNTRWDRVQRAQVFTEAWRLRSLDPQLSDLELLRRAQKILPKEKQREISTLAKPIYAWFRNCLAEAASPSNAPLPDATATPPAAEVKAPQPEPIPTEEPEEFTPGLLEILRGLVEALEEQREDIRKDHVVLREAIHRVTSMERGLQEVTQNIGKMLSQGFTATFFPTGLAPTIAAVTPPAVNEKPLAPKPPVSTRKPRVIVLDLRSGHEKEGVSQGVKGYVGSVSFMNTAFSKVPPFAEFDYVICTKYTSYLWITEAKKTIPPSKLIIVQGTVRERIVPAIQKLEPVPIEVKE